jgi:hypothetical protein
MSSVRLTFEYEDDTLRLTKAREIDKKPAPSDPLQGYEGQAGFWFELRDAAGKTIYRRVMRNPMPVYYEVHAAASPSTHLPVKTRSGTFEVVIPTPPPGAVVVLFSTPQPSASPVGDVAAERARAAVPRTGTAPAQEIARFAIEGVTR